MHFNLDLRNFLTGGSKTCELKDKNQKTFEKRRSINNCRNKRGHTASPAEEWLSVIRQKLDPTTTVGISVLATWKTYQAHVPTYMPKILEEKLWIAA